ncbi:MAG: MarR family transcriptional regulator, partial [Clostridiales bacterium]|nr:MarR family transcriptional regulator [Clostridiales bacterium]
MNCPMIETYFSSFQLLLASQKDPKTYGSGQWLYPFEMRMLETVHTHPNYNSVALAEIMGVSKGAVTQYGNKLEEKEMVSRYCKKGNKKERFYQLTSLGEAVIEEQEKFHEEANQQICEYVRSLSEKERNTI